MAALFVSVIGYGLATILWLAGLVFLCVMFSDECRGERTALAFMLCGGLMTMALLFAATTAKLTGAL